MGIALAGLTTALFTSQTSHAADAAGYYTDPATGIVYRQVTKTVERPVVETKVETQEQTVFHPQTVTETKPEARTVFTPVVDYHWEPRLEGRWNPFRQPTVAYRHVPRARWQAQQEIVNRTETRTQWVAEKRTVDVPKLVQRIEREQKVDYEPVGRVAPAGADPPGASNALASRLRPMDSGTRVEPLSAPQYYVSPTPTIAATAIASTSGSVGRMTSDPPRRTASQGGLRGTELYPTAPAGYGQALPPTSTGTGVAALPVMSLWR
tara:strand:+ start:1047776 stop:1048570 length:795 start_codon:yes stop_codon:yes gene_type:complete